MKKNQPTAKQIAARKKFAAMAKDGTLAKKRAISQKSKKIDFEGNLNSVTVIFKEKKHNYRTTVSKETTKIDAQKYFIGKFFNVASYPKEDYQPCIDITYHQNPKNKGLNAPLTKGLRTFAAKTAGVAGLKKEDGTLKKGYKYLKGGKIVKVAPKKTTAKKCTK